MDWKHSWIRYQLTEAQPHKDYYLYRVGLDLGVLTPQEVKREGGGAGWFVLTDEQRSAIVSRVING